MNKRILKLTLPNIVSNITVPLLGMVDLAIVGHLGSLDYIGAIAIATTIFNFIYWNFGFLRMGTSGYTAQAYGAKDLSQAVNTLVKAVFIASLLIALVVIALQYPLCYVALLFFDVNADMADMVRQYFFIRIWAAPATLLLYVFNGWFIGMQNANTPMIVAIVSNVLNILFSLLLAIGCKMGIAGVAWGTLLAQYAGLLLSVLFWSLFYRKLWKKINIAKSLVWKDMKQFLQVNRDIFLRSFCLLMVFSFVPLAGAQQGEMVLAINTLLLQFLTIFSYIMDGFAYAGEALSGKYIGSKDRQSLYKMITYIFVWGAVMSLCFTLIYAFGGNVLLAILTNQNEIIEAAGQYYFWVLAIPLAGFAAFLWDGIYIGATASKEMRNTMIVATGIFFVIYYMFYNVLGNNALWLAIIAFLMARSLSLTILVAKKQNIFSRFFNEES
ncbi:MAG: MATE family efflux transporter [Bacteroidales bacterium]|nr:MATE family efflux transporter [Bacteroidales bacterium]